MKKLTHIGIILDGNRRWAAKRGLPSFEGHLEGLNNLKKIIAYAQKRGLKILSVFVFSTENWNRSKDEVNYLMSLIESFFREEYEKKELFRKIKVRVVGERDRLSQRIKDIIDKIEEETKDHKEMVLNIAFNYGGKKEILGTIKKMISQGVPLTEENISRNLFVPDIDLVIRTGFEKRLSNFFIWQTAYSELYFPEKYWPDFSERDLDIAIEDYNSRQRRFGK